MAKLITLSATTAIQQFASRGRNDERPVQGATSLLTSIALSLNRETSIEGDKPELGKGWNKILYVDKRADQISYILRLGHVVLKREWERVKHTR